MWPVHLLYIQRHFALPHPLFVWQEFECHSPQQWRLYNSEIFYNKGFKSTELLMNFCDNHENFKGASINYYSQKQWILPTASYQVQSMPENL